MTLLNDIGFTERVYMDIYLPATILNQTNNGRHNRTFLDIKLLLIKFKLQCMINKMI